MRENTTITNNKKFFLIVFLYISIILVPCVLAENVIFGNTIPEEDRLSSINITSDTFYYNEMSCIRVFAYNSNKSTIDVNNLTINGVNFQSYIDYSAFTEVTQDLSKQYKRCFAIGNENLKSLTFLVTATQGDKVISQQYTTTISENIQHSTTKEKIILSLNIVFDFIVNYWVWIMLSIVGIFMMIFIIKAFTYLTK